MGKTKIFKPAPIGPKPRRSVTLQARVTPDLDAAVDNAAAAAGVSVSDWINQVIQNKLFGGEN